MMFNETSNIRQQLLIPFALSLFIILLGIQIILHFYQNDEQRDYAHALNTELNKSFRYAVKNEAEEIYGFLNFIKNSNEIKRAWLTKNKEDLLDISLPVFQHLNKNHYITHFYYHNLDATNFLRVHYPEKNGDLIDRATLHKTIKTAGPAAGIEFGTLGQFVLRVVVPWELNGELVGYLELGKEIDHILEHLSLIHGYQLALSVSADFIKKHKLDQTERFSDKANSSKTSNGFQVINQTFTNTPSPVLNFIDDDIDDSIVFKNEVSSYLISSITIQDFSAENVGKLTYFYDMGDFEENHKSLSWRMLAINMFAGLILLIFYYLYSGRINKTLQQNYSMLNNEINERKEIELELLRNTDQLEELIEDRSARLAESKKMYRTLFDKTADALLLIEGNKYIECNQATLNMLGYETKEELYNTHPSSLSPEFQPDGQSSEKKADLMIATAFKRSSHRFEWEFIRKNGEVFPVEVLLTAIPFEGEQLLHVVWRDITERKKAEKEINYRAYYDSLTKLPNRQLLIDRLEQSVKASRRRKNYNALLFIDLDRFKTINDSLGHSIGDLLLKETARRIKSCIREEDTAARFGGDEFVILLKQLGNEQEHASLIAERIAQCIQKQFTLPFKLDNNEFYITSSIGINIFPLGDESIEDIIKFADTAMYSGKESGRNKITFYLSKMHDTVLKRLLLEKDLRQAIKDGQLEVYYQPQMDNNSEIVGIEALTRWKHPVHGYVSPEEFIAIAEDSGMILDVGEFVLHQAIKDTLSLQNNDCMPIPLSINISPHQFRHPSFIDQISQIMQQYNLKHQYLTLEVTESIIINNLAETTEKFEHLRNLGIRISLDDFGTGYSSLSYLKRLPLDEIKIDKSFVFDVFINSHNALLVQTIINIADQFGLDIVAEGVETEEQLNFLKQHNCKIYQGYYYSQPLPLEQLKMFLQNNLNEQFETRQQNYN